MLKQLNANLDEKKKEEGAQAALAFGRTETFQEYLAKDKTYEKEVEKERKRQQSWFSMFWTFGCIATAKNPRGL